MLDCLFFNLMLQFQYKISVIYLLCHIFPSTLKFNTLIADDASLINTSFPLDFPCLVEQSLNTRVPSQLLLRERELIVRVGGTASSAESEY